MYYFMIYPKPQTMVRTRVGSERCRSSMARPPLDAIRRALCRVEARKAAPCAPNTQSSRHSLSPGHAPMLVFHRFQTPPLCRVEAGEGALCSPNTIIQSGSPTGLPSTVTAPRNVGPAFWSGVAWSTSTGGYSHRATWRFYLCLNQSLNDSMIDIRQDTLNEYLIDCPLSTQGTVVVVSGGWAGGYSHSTSRLLCVLPRWGG